MIERAYDNNSFGDITKSDLEKIMSIYETDGFEELPVEITDNK